MKTGMIGRGPLGWRTWDESQDRELNAQAERRTDPRFRKRPGCLVPAILAGICCLGLAHAAPSAGIFSAETFGGTSYFLMDETTAQFQVNVMDIRYWHAELHPSIFTLGIQLPFELGVGSPTYYGAETGTFFPDPFLPPGPPPPFIPLLVLLGTQYRGSFACTPPVYADLLAGGGELTLFSDSGGLVSSTPMTFVSFLPEPSGVALLLCGIGGWRLSVLRRKPTPKAPSGLRRLWPPPASSRCAWEL